MDRLLRGLTGVFLWGVILFVAAGRVNWKRAWVYVALYVSTLVIGEIVVSVKSPGILQERAQRHANTKTFDKVIVPLFVLTFFLLPVWRVSTRFVSAGRMSGGGHSLPACRST